MTSRRVDVERVSFVSSKPFDAVLAAVEGAIGHPDMAMIASAIQSSPMLAEFEDVVRPGLGPTGLMLFLRLDLGSVLRKEMPDAPQMVRLLIGNPLIMKEMAKHVADAGSYAPVTVLVSERPDGVHLTYDRMASLLAPYGDADALAVARDLDSKVERLLQQAAE